MGRTISVSCVDDTIIEVVERGAQGIDGVPDLEYLAPVRGNDDRYPDWVEQAYFAGDRVQHNVAGIKQLRCLVDIPSKPFDLADWVMFGTEQLDDRLDTHTTTADRVIIDPLLVTEAYKDANTVHEFLDISSSMNGGNYHLETLNAGLYDPMLTGAFDIGNLVWTEIGTIQVDGVANINGSYHINYAGDTGESLSEGDAIYITDQVTLPVDESEVEDSDTYTLDTIVDTTHLIVNKPILRSPFNPYDSDFKIYKLTYTQRRATDDMYVTFTGQGQIGYPFQKTVVQPNQIARSTQVGPAIVWSIDVPADRPVYYGVVEDEVTQLRPQGLFAKHATTDNGLELTQFMSYNFAGIRYRIAPTPANFPFLLENHPVQNVHIVSNQVNYDLSAYPNSYVIVNHQGISNDIVVLYGEVGTNPSFGEDKPEFIDIAHVNMDDSGVIISVVDSFWAVGNGSYENKVSATSKIHYGCTVFDNGLATTPPEPTRYSIESGSITTSYNETLDYTSTPEITVVSLWPDGDHRTGLLRRDFRWYDPTATIPDPQEPNATHALIPFGSFSVDFIYIYQKPDNSQGNFRDFYIVKGDRLYTSVELVQGVEILSVDPTNESNIGYLPIAALVQYGSTDAGFHNIIDIRTYVSGESISIVTPEFLEDLSAKTQFRSANNVAGFWGYNINVRQGDPVPQGWTLDTTLGGSISVVTDPLGGESLQVIDGSVGSVAEMSRDVLGIDIQDAYLNGYAFNTTVYPYTSSAVDPSSVQMGWGWEANNDPTSRPFYNFLNSARVILDTQAEWSNTGSLQWSFEASGFQDFQSSPRYFGASEAMNDSSVAVYKGSAGGGNIALILNYQIRNGHPSLPPKQEKLITYIQGTSGVNMFDPHTIRIDRNGNQIEVYLDNVLRTVDNSTWSSEPMLIGTFSNADDGQGASGYLYDVSVTDATTKLFWPIADNTVDVSSVVIDPLFPQVVTGSIAVYSQLDWNRLDGVAKSLGFDTTTDGVNTTIILERSVGQLSITFAEVGFFNINVNVVSSPDPDNFSDWGNASIEFITPSGIVVTDPAWTDIPWTNNVPLENKVAVNTSVDANIGKESYFKNIGLTVNRDSNLIVTNVSDFSLNNIYNLTGDRDWTVQLPSAETIANQTVSINMYTAKEHTLTITRDELLGGDVLINDRAELSITVPAGSHQFVITSLNTIYSGIAIPYRIAPRSI